MTARASLLELEPGQCRWPVNDGAPFLFCAAPSLRGSSYCACHASLSVGEGTRSERNALRTARWVAGSETPLTSRVE